MTEDAWARRRAPLIERPDPLADPRVSAVSLLATALSVVAVRSVAFAIVLLGALLLHELAHRAVARAYGARVGWPLFLPMPVFVGTLGAVLPVREWPRTRSALLRVGASGPLAGVAVVAVVTWLRWPQTGAGELAAPLGWRLFGVDGVDATDPWLHGAWAMCLVTGMNLLPIGQLDGGHVAAALLPAAWARRVGWAAIALVVGLGLAWPWWWPWLGALWALGALRPADVVTGPLGTVDRAIGAAAGVVGVGCFVPAPW